MAKDRTEGLPEPMTFQADANSRRKKGVQRPVFAEVFQLDGVSADLPKKVHLMVNPYAGKKKGRDVAKRVIELVEQAGVEVECSYSAYSGHLVTVASALVVGENEVIAVVGGDAGVAVVVGVGGGVTVAVGVGVADTVFDGVSGGVIDGVLVRLLDRVTELVME